MSASGGSGPLSIRSLLFWLSIAVAASAPFCCDFGAGLVCANNCLH